MTGQDLERHTPVYIRTHSWQCLSEQKTSPEVEELPAEPWDRTVTNRSAELKVSKSKVASIILKWKKCGKPRTLAKAGNSKTEQSGGKGLGKRGHQEPRWEKLPAGQPSLQHSTNLGFMVEQLDGSLSSVKVCKKAPKRYKKQDSLA